MKNILLSAGEVITRVVGDVVESERLTTSMELSDRIGYALQRTLIGVLIIFGVLAVIWLVLSLFKVVFYKGQDNKKADVKKEEPKEVTSATNAVASAPVAPVQDDGAVIAAIVAAISAMRAEQGIVDGFRVVSFKRGTKKPWNIK